MFLVTYRCQCGHEQKEVPNYVAMCFFRCDACAKEYRHVPPMMSDDGFALTVAGTDDEFKRRWADT